MLITFKRVMSPFLKTHAVYVGRGDSVASDFSLQGSGSTGFDADRLNTLAIPRWKFKAAMTVDEHSTIFNNGWLLELKRNSH